jgi:hypothetical protein
MGRGDKQTYNQQQQGQLAQNNDVLQQALQDRQQTGAMLSSNLQDILANPGYSAADKQSILGSTESALGGSFGDAQQQIADRAARTGNSAGYLAAEEALGQQKARSMSQAAGNLTSQFANTALNQRALALSGLQNLYNSNTPLIGDAMGSNTSLIGDQGRLAGIPGFGSQLALNAARGVESAALAGIG